MMSRERKWTPGPWEYQEWGALIVDSGKGSAKNLLAKVQINTYRDEGRHNANLIAAAPDLVEALEELVFIFKVCDETGYIEGEGFVDMDAAIKKAEAALDRAYGETNYPLINKEGRGMIDINIDFGNDGFTVSAKLMKDGDKWCVLAGENLQEGVAGFGGQIWEAVSNFKSEFRNN